MGNLSAQSRAITITALLMFLNIILVIIYRHDEWSLMVISNFFQTFAPLLVTIWLFRRYLTERSHDRNFWLFLAFSHFFYACAMIIWDVYEIFLHTAAPFPSAADIMWILVNAFQLAALLWVIVKNRKSLRIAQILYDVSIIFIVTAFFCWEYILKPAINSNQGTFEKVLSLIYPVSDLLVLFILLCIYYSGTVKEQLQVFWVIFSGIILLLLADTFYFYLETHHAYQTGNPIDLLWTAGILLVGLSSFYGRGEPVLTFEPPKAAENTIGDWTRLIKSPRLMVPYLGVLMLFLLTICQDQVFNSLIIGSVLTLILILLRQVYTLAENKSLLKKLTVLNKDLERTVTERTVELMNKNTLLEKSIKQVEYLAYHDHLTGLPNYRYFSQQLEETLAAAKQRNETVAILFLDLDRFKLINDSFGHSIGDFLLQETAKRLSGCIGDSGIICRQGGDEFLVFLPNTSREKTAKLAKQILHSLQRVTDIKGNELIVTSSIGISLFPEHGEEIDLLLQRADTAMYSAKKALRNRYSFYHSSLSSGTADMLHLERDLRYAIERQEFYLVYQPLIHIDTGAIKGVEALVRWDHPYKGFISPGTFIPVAEETGLIIPMGTWILETACKQWRTWREKGFPPLTIAVNVSINQFMDEQYLEHVRRIIQETGMDPNYLELEITENIPFESSHASHVVQELSQMGIKLSIDDFGTGYSSLQYLKKMPIHTLKIDQSFVRDLPNDSNDASIVQTIISMAKHMHLEVIAEGVESNEQLAFLKNYQCQMAQGYFFSKPLPSRDVEALLNGSTQGGLVPLS
ncbi:putative bifunctional diguanylate cyclase/phosphodiesterase [Niallia endozanthoxylica]|uniref:EAL domain-containing protein n=1 Tax=Niallia endozanthoxylica TaxID=2036016 RepID=A0A5J5GTH0_9BACI|nr:EAL domain-containing protein [Niallia endozanthoxylica]KAA9010928.1 EAL domain-containing protein [Niallia endozanthoxylica]